MELAQFWWRQLRIPLLIFVPLAAVLATTSVDTWIAHGLFFDETRSHWLGAGSWWTNELLHTGGQWAIRIVAALALALWVSAAHSPRLRALRRPSAYFFVALVLSIGTVGLLKSLTNVDCPRDLTEFGGAFPFVHLFADRPDALRHARCFPAAHASAGYALIALYFALRERGRGLARSGLALGLALGLVFGLAQQSRGAHFASHDVWSAFIVWAVSLTLYTFVFEARLWSAVQATKPAPTRHETSAATGRLHAGGITDVQRCAGAIARTQCWRSAGRPALAGAGLHLQHADRAARSVGSE